MTTAIVSAFITNNTISQSDLPGLIALVHAALAAAGAPEPSVAAPSLTTAQIRRSITPDGLTSFEDGRPYKMLKRHLTVRGMTIADYRSKWGLPADYPSTAPGYSVKRSAIALAAGLGRAAKSPPTAAPKAPTESKAGSPAKPKAPTRGRPRKTPTSKE